MTAQTYYIVAALILVALLPLVPKMVAVRTRVLNALRLRRLAGWHERNAGTLVVMVRVIMSLVAVVLAVLAFASQ